MRAIVAIAVIISLLPPAQACAWIIGTSKDGHRVHASPRSTAQRLKDVLVAAIRTDLTVEGQRLEKELRASSTFGERNDYAVAMMYLGRASEAVPLLEKLESEQPGRYEVAANLGTAHELAGNNRKALQWIRTAMDRNEQSHFGTEWLHIRILDQVTMDRLAWPINELLRAAEYQLTERLKFVKGKDPAVAALLFEFAQLEAASATLESAKDVLELSLAYGYSPERIRPLISRYNRMILLRQFRYYSLHVALVAACLFLLIYEVTIRTKRCRLG
jgi:TPR repeat protein